MSKIPEWFEMTAGDNEPETPKHKFAGKSRVKLIAIATVPLIITGGALVFADGGTEDDLPKNAPTLSPTANNANSSEKSAKSSNTEKQVIVQSSSTGKSQSINTQTGIQAPSGINNPRRGHREDGDHFGREGHDGFGEHEDDGFGEDD